MVDEDVRVFYRLLIFLLERRRKNLEFFMYFLNNFFLVMAAPGDVDVTPTCVKYIF